MRLSSVIATKYATITKTTIVDFAVLVDRQFEVQGKQHALSLTLKGVTDSVTIGRLAFQHFS